MSQRGVVLYLHVHQPWRIKPYTVFDTARDHEYFSQSPAPEQDNELIFHKVASKSYLPMNKVLERLLNEQPNFKLSLSITGTFLEQAEQFAPEVLDSFKRLVETGRVEMLAETYHHSLAFFYSLKEFEAQVEKHRQKIREVFGVEVKVFRNTELAYNDELARWADGAGFKGVLAEGWDKTLGWHSPNYVYRPSGTEQIRLLMKNYRLSDDIAFRFSDHNWVGWPLTPDKYVTWVDNALADADILNLFMDYETFGEHQWADTGIFDFFEQFVRSWLAKSGNNFYTVSEAIDNFEAKDEISVPETTTWADSERDLTAWLGNNLQKEAMRYLYGLEDSVVASGDLELIDDWRKLQTADHAYYMCTKWSNDGDVHAYFSPYDSPYDAFLYYMNVIRDMRWRLSDGHNGGDKDA